MAATMLSHTVYFTLHDASEAAQDRLVEIARKYLANHPGVLFFGVGKLCKELNRPVNDQEFQVGLNVVFDSKESHVTYQTAPDHLKFIEEGKPNWAKVRVFDSWASR